jgi:hypothetical protein
MLFWDNCSQDFFESPTLYFIRFAAEPVFIIFVPASRMREESVPPAVAHLFCDHPSSSRALR